MPKYLIHQHVFGYRPGEVVESDESGWETMVHGGMATRVDEPKPKAKKKEQADGGQGSGSESD